MNDERSLSHIEMIAAEKEAARQAEVWLRAYLDFPNVDNFNGVIARMVIALAHSCRRAPCHLAQSSVGCA